MSLPGERYLPDFLLLCLGSGVGTLLPEPMVRLGSCKERVHPAQGILGY